jgi:hypothetical protein
MSPCFRRDLCHIDRESKVRENIATKMIDATRIPNKTMNTVLMSS